MGGSLYLHSHGGLCLSSHPTWCVNFLLLYMKGWAPLKGHYRLPVFAPADRISITGPSINGIFQHLLLLVAAMETWRRPVALLSTPSWIPHKGILCQDVHFCRSNGSNDLASQELWACALHGAVISGVEAIHFWQGKPGGGSVWPTSLCVRILL